MHFDRIFVNILEYLHELLHTRDDPRKETPAPHMASEPVDPIEGHREDAHDPLHHPRQTRRASWPDHKVDMIPHDAEIFEPEVVFQLRPTKNLKE